MDEAGPAFVAAGNFLGLVAEHAGPAFVVVEFAVLHVPVPDAVVGALEGELPTLFGEVEVLLEFLLAGDVAVEADEEERAAIGIAVEMAVGFDVAD